MQRSEDTPTAPIPPSPVEKTLEQGSGQWIRVSDPQLAWENTRPHTCAPPVLTPEMPIGNGSLWGCTCGRRFRVNRRGDVLNWVIAN